MSRLHPLNVETTSVLEAFINDQTDIENLYSLYTELKNKADKLVNSDKENFTSLEKYNTATYDNCKQYLKWRLTYNCNYPTPECDPKHPCYDERKDSYIEVIQDAVVYAPAGIKNGVHTTKAIKLTAGTRFYLPNQLDRTPQILYDTVVDAKYVLCICDDNKLIIADRNKFKGWRNKYAYTALYSEGNYILDEKTFTVKKLISGEWIATDTLVPLCDLTITDFSVNRPYAPAAQPFSRSITLTNFADQFSQVSVE